MKVKTKVQMANLSIWVMAVAIFLIMLWLIASIVTATFDLNVLNKKASDFITAIMGFAALLIIGAAIFNISLNLSLIADSKTDQSSLEEKSFFNKKFYLAIGLIIVLLISFLFTGDYLTRSYEQKNLVSEANDIVNRYNQSIDDIALSLNNPSKINRIPDILKFLSSQKEEFPMVMLITNTKYNGQSAYLKIATFTGKEAFKEPYYGGSFYKCKKEDCSYLQDVFQGKSSQTYYWTKENDYRLYYPFSRKGSKFILLFTKYQPYGKIGSN